MGFIDEWSKELNLPTNELHFFNESLKKFHLKYLEIADTIYKMNTKDRIQKKLDEWFSLLEYGFNFKEKLITNHGHQIYAGSLPAPNPVVISEFEKNKIAISKKSLELRQVEYLISFTNDLITQFKSDISYLENKIRDIENTEFVQQSLLQGNEVINLSKEGIETSKSDLIINLITSSVTIGYLIVGLLFVSIIV